MTELFIDSLTLNSIGLFVLGSGFLVTHFWNRRKRSRDTDVIVIDGIRESLLSRLFKVKFLLIGIGFIAGAIIWGIQDYERSLMDRNIQILEETLSIVRSSKSLDAKRRAVRDMESIIPLSILEKQNEKSMEEWYDSNKNLTIVLENVNEPICVQLFMIYRAVKRFDKIDKLDRIYAEFYKDYWGEITYNRNIKTIRRRKEVEKMMERPNLTRQQRDSIFELQVSKMNKGIELD